MLPDEIMHRRLAVILAADMVGYSRLMAEDEEATLGRLATYQQVIDGLVTEHKGRVFGMAGDGVMAEFASAVQGVRCAVAIQRALERRNADLPDSRRMVFRIGINLGDVISRGADLYGDGVNIAARLQALAEPGQICIAASVHEQIEGKLNLRCTFLGEKALKNIPRPARVYSVDWVLSPPVHVDRLSGEKPALPDKPSIAVLPLLNLSGDADQDYFADGLTEDLITTLAKFRWFFVISRNSSFIYKGRTGVDAKQVSRDLGVRYIVEGSVRKGGTRVRITAQLIDAETGRHVWAERYDRDLADLFAVQDEIVERVVGAIEPEMLRTETRRARQKGSESLTAWDLIFRGMWHFHHVAAEHYWPARDLFRKAVATSPSLAEAHTWLARCNAGLIAYGWSENPADDKAEGWQAALRARRLAETDPYAHYAVGIMSFALGQPGPAMEAAQRAIDLSPSFALGHLLLGLARVLGGRAAQAIEPLQRGLRLSPHDPQQSTWQQILAFAYLFHGETEAAAIQAAEAAAMRPESFSAHCALACSLARLNRSGEAQEALLAMQNALAGNDRELEGFLERFLQPRYAEQVLADLRALGWKS